MSDDGRLVPAGRPGNSRIIDQVTTMSGGVRSSILLVAVVLCLRLTADAASDRSGGEYDMLIVD